MDGIDENHCEELEYNECEENEFRCQDGSCIPEEYWLDGEYDCSDKSDEQGVSRDSSIGDSCPLISSEFDCDEATDKINYFACGDGHFVELGFMYPEGCYNYRIIMFFCEKIWNSKVEQPRWTLDNGHCVDRGRLEKNLTDMNESEKCVLYLKCKLSDGASDMCDGIIKYFNPLCRNRTVIYPSEPVLSPYLRTVYDLTRLHVMREPNYLLVNGSIKCIGHNVSYELRSSSMPWWNFATRPKRIDDLLCREYRTMNIRSPHINESCWSNSKQSFLCKYNMECISKHRLRDGIEDCYVVEDESKEQQCYMTNQQQHRLKCSDGNSFKCIPTTSVGDMRSSCEGNDDEYLEQLKWLLYKHRCRKGPSSECNVLKSYISSSSSATITNDKVIRFRRYCDTFFHLSKGFDESSCKEWKCSRTDYQCLSGHCVSRELFWRFSHDWSCPDATDHIGLLRLTHLSNHNAQTENGIFINSKKTYLINTYIGNSDYESFPTICNRSKEYGCLLADVDEPLNFVINRPCINLTQIGDGIIDCYGGLDERNLLTCGKNDNDQRGFDFHCSDEECIPYHRLCKDRCSNNADHLLCVQLKTYLNSSCRYNTHIDICASIEQCYSNRIGYYYCDLLRICK